MEYKDSNSSNGENNKLLNDKDTFDSTIPAVKVIFESDDSFQSIDMRYCYTIEDLHQFKHIHKENDLYTRKVPDPTVLAIPKGVVSGGSNLSKNMKNDSVLNFQALDQTPLLNHSRTNSEANEILFNNSFSQGSYDTALQNSEWLNEDEDEKLPIFSNPKPNVVSRLNCSDLGGDVTIFSLLIFAAIMLLAIPLIYLFYVAYIKLIK